MAVKSRRTGPIRFNGKAWAELEEQALKNELAQFVENYQITPKIVVIMVGDNKANKLYTRLKQQAAERMGIKFELQFYEDIEKSDLLAVIDKLNNDKKVHGIMIQMPLSASLEDYKDEIIDEILPEKDVDGLRESGVYVHPTAGAIVSVLEQSTGANLESKIAVVGASGMVGSAVVKELTKIGYKNVLKLTGKSNLEKLKDCDVVISATGKTDLIKAEMIKIGASLIDVGYPKGDFCEECFEKASFYTPVPGGVGPITIVLLMKNVLVGARGSVNLS